MWFTLNLKMFLNFPNAVSGRILSLSGHSSCSHKMFWQPNSSKYAVNHKDCWLPTSADRCATLFWASWSLYSVCKAFYYFNSWREDRTLMFQAVGHLCLPAMSSLSTALISASSGTAGRKYSSLKCPLRAFLEWRKTECTISLDTVYFRLLMIQLPLPNTIAQFYQPSYINFK